MLIAAAVCPHPPLLIPAAAGGPAPATRSSLGCGRPARRPSPPSGRTPRPDRRRRRSRAHRGIPGGHPASLREFGVPFTRGPAAPEPGRLGRSPALADRRKVAALPRYRYGGGDSAAQTSPFCGGGSPRTHGRASAWNWGGRWPGSHRGWRCSPWGTVPGRRARGAPGAATPPPTATTRRWRGRWPPTPRALAALDPPPDGPPVHRGPCRLAGPGRRGWPGRFRRRAGLRGGPFEVSYFVASWRRAGTLGTWARTSSPWWGRPPPASPGWASRWPGSSAARS